MKITGNIHVLGVELTTEFQYFGDYVKSKVDGTAHSIVYSVVIKIEATHKGNEESFKRLLYPPAEGLTEIELK